MKIYPQEHEILESPDILVKDIPLAYIDTADNQYKVDINVENEFLVDERKQIRPYDSFSDEFTCFFDANDKIKNNVSLKRKGNRYYYEPDDMEDFAPVRFSCSVNCRRKDKYNSGKEYDIKVWTYSEKLADKLIAIFGSSWKTGEAPQNIKVNGGAMENGQYYNQSLEEMMKDDFLFFESPDGVHYKTLDDNENEILKDIPIDKFLDNHVNIWLSVDKFDEMIDQVTDAPLHVTPQIFNKREYDTRTRGGIRIFNLDYRHSHYSNSVYVYALLNYAILLLEKPGKGFIVVTHKGLLENSKHYAGMIYEVMFYVYCNSYFDVPTKETWITASPVDYAVDHADQFSKSQGSINLYRAMQNCEQNTDVPYTIVSVNTSKPDIVVFSGIDSDGEMHFISKARNEPKKPSDAVSYYTSSGNIVYYVPEDIYLIERPFKAGYSVDSNNTIYIIVEPAKSSLHKIHTEQTYKLTVPNNLGTYYICANPLPGELSTIFTLVLDSDYDESKNGYKIATVVISCEQRTKTYDVRIMGGGLPEQLADDYNMMDIGNLNGRPYRLGSTNIIRLPLAYQKYKNDIESAVNLHAASGEYNIIVFDDRDRKEGD